MYLFFRKLFTICLILRLCTAQSTTTPTCTGCNMNVDVITTSNTTWSYDDPATGTPYLEGNLLFIAYSITTTSSVPGNCITRTSSPVPLIDTYVVPVPSELYCQPPTSTTLGAAQYYNCSNSLYTAFLDDAYSSFEEDVGYEGCTATLPPSQSFPTFVGKLALATALPSATPAATALSSASPPKGLVPVRGAHSTQIIIISVLVPVAGLMILLLCFIVIRRYRKKRSQAGLTDQSEMTSNVQLYVDQKAELEDENRRRHELEAGVIRHEVEGEDKIFEMPGNGNSRTGLVSSNQTQELGGAEHSKELEVPGNI